MLKELNMTLMRNIIYWLCLVLLISFAGLFSPYSILVNISSGLFSGAAISILSSITQYFNYRSTFLANLYSLLGDCYKLFRTDEDLLRQSIMFLREHNMTEIKSCEGFRDFHEVNNDIIQRYKSWPPHFNYHDFVPLNPFDKKSKQLFKSIDHEIWFARGELIRFHDELLNVKEAQTESDLFECLYSRTYLYTALASGIINIYVDAEAIAARFKLTCTKEYQSWLYNADGAYLSVLENEDYLLYGEDFDEGDDSDEDNDNLESI